MSTQVELLRKYGLEVRGHLGQHLLIDPNTQRKIADALRPGEKEWILEIGPGLGALTVPLLEKGGRVLACEKDARFAEILKGELAGFRDRFRLLEGDVLETPWPEEIQKTGSGLWKVAGNLPYYITGPVLFRIMEWRRLFSEGVFMMQKEVAQRIMAPSGSRTYGRLSVGIRLGADVEHLFDVSPYCFTPKPKVQSSVLRFRFHNRLDDIEGFNHLLLERVVRGAFAQRRKTLLKALESVTAPEIDRGTLRQVFEAADISSRARAEELLPTDFITLTQALDKCLAPGLPEKRKRQGG